MRVAVLVLCTSSDDALWFLGSACYLMMLYVSMKFHENILMGFQVTVGTQNDHCQISKGNNYKTV